MTFFVNVHRDCVVEQVADSIFFCKAGVSCLIELFDMCDAVCAELTLRLTRSMVHHDFVKAIADCSRQWKYCTDSIDDTPIPYHQYRMAILERGSVPRLSATMRAPARQDQAGRCSLVVAELQLGCKICRQDFPSKPSTLSAHLRVIDLCRETSGVRAASG
jgi:hypothetical protein